MALYNTKLFMKFKLYLAILLAILFSFFGIVNKATAQTRLMQQIELLEQEKTSRTPAQQKISSQLLQAAKEKTGQKFVDGVDLEPAKVNAKPNGDVIVDVDGNITDALLTKIQALGARVIYPSAQFHTVRIEINLSLIEKIAAFNEVRLIEPAAVASTVGTGFPGNVLSKSPADLSDLKLTTSYKRTKLTFEQRAEKVRAAVKKYLTTQGLGTGKGKTGAINSQGDRTHRADDVRNIYGYAGAGVKVGVLS